MITMPRQIAQTLSSLRLMGLLLGIGAASCYGDPAPAATKVAENSRWDSCEANPFHACSKSIDCKCGGGVFTCDATYYSPYSTPDVHCAVWDCASDEDCKFLTDGHYPKCEIQANPQLKNYCRR